MPKTNLTASAIAALKPRDKPYAVQTGVPNLRLHVSPKGTKTFQLRRNGTMITLGRLPEITLADARRIALTGETPEVVAKATRTIGEWIKQYGDDNAHLVSVRIRVASLRLALAPILKQQVSALTTPWLEQRFAALKGTFKPRTLKTYRTNVVMLTNYIVDHDGLPKSPFRRLSPIPVERRVKFLDLEDIEKLEGWCERSADLKLACFAMIGLHTGMRRSEILSLQRSEIDLDPGEPTILVLATKAKARRERQIWLSETLRAFLAERLPKLPDRDPFLFRSVDARFARMVTEAELGVRATPHVLRHTAGSQMISRGAPLTAVRDILGHADFYMTNIYAHATRRDLHDAARLLDTKFTTADVRRLEELQKKLNLNRS